MFSVHDPISPWLRSRGVPHLLVGVLHAVVIGVALVGLSLALGRLVRPWENDAFGFWSAWKDGNLYDLRWLDVGAYVYAPVLAQIAYPLTLLSWPTFSIVWNVAQLGALIGITGPVWAAALIWLLPWPTLPGYDNAVLATLENGNPMIILGMSVVAAYRWPAFWALAILMKVTPVIGLVWFAVRREWTRLAIAAGATAILSGVSFVVAPQLWVDWVALLLDAAGKDTVSREIIPLPLAVRGLAALAIIVWGARTDRYWTVPIGVMLSLPAIALGGYAVAVGALAFLRLPYIPRLWSRGGGNAVAHRTTA